MGTPFYGIWNRAKGDIIPETLQEVCGDRLLGQVPTDDEIESFDYKRLDPKTTTNHYISFSILNSQFNTFPPSPVTIAVVFSRIIFS